MHLIIDATTTQTKPHSGIGQYVKNLLSEMLRSYPTVKFTLLLYDGETTLNESLLDLSNVDIFNLGKPLGTVTSLAMYEIRLKPAIKKVLKNSKESDPTLDVLYFCPFFQHGFPKSGSINGLKSVLTIHDFAMPYYNYYSDRGGVFNAIRKQEYWYHMDRSEYVDAIITHAEYTVLDYMRYYPNFDTDKLFSIMLGVELNETEIDVSKYLPSDWDKRGYFIYMGGGIQKNKNSEGVVQAYANFVERFEADPILNKDQPPYLVIAGKIFMNDSFPQSVSLRKKINDLGMKDHVHFSGYYEDESTYTLLKNSIAFIHLSLFEGFGIAVAEAMRVGKVVIVHDGTTYPEVVGDAGYLVDGTDAEGVGEIMFDVFTDRDGAKEMGLAARERSFMFDWKKTAKETMAVFYSLTD